MGAILLLAATLRLWRLDQNGFGREYYAAGVRSMLGGWHLFFYNAFDPAGFVSIDKPPVALWLQAASAWLFGFGSFAVMLPQVLEGVAAVLLVFLIVRRGFGQVAGLLAALLLAVTPICVAVDRSNNTDSCLVLFLLLAAWALIVAIEKSSLRWLVLAMALVGVAFNVKMLAAWVVVPAWGLAWLVGANALPLRRRVLALAASALVLVAVSLCWMAAFDLTPQEARPYAGSTRNNSMLELALLHNGFERFRAAREPAPSAGETPAAKPRRALWDQTPVGATRLVTRHMASQFAWWLPLSLLGLFAAWRGHRAQAMVWAGWTLMYALVFSFAGGVFHTYYLAALGAPLAALGGVGAAWAWSQYRTGARPWLLPVALLAVAAWQWHAGFDAWTPGLDDWRTLLLLAAVGVLVAMSVALPALRKREVPATGFAISAAVAMLALPLAWSLSVVLVRPNVAAPATGMAAFDGAAPVVAAPRQGSRLLRFLREQRGGERYLLAVPSASLAAPLITRTGEPVMAMGGYLGHDPILTPEALQRLVERGELRFVMLGGPALTRVKTPGQRALEDWIRAHGQPVSRALWAGASPSAAPRPASDGPARRPAQLFDLRPYSYADKGTQLQNRLRSP